MDDEPFEELRRGLRGFDQGPEAPRLQARHALAGAGVALVLGAGIVVATAARPPSTEAAPPSPTIDVVEEPAATTTTAVARVWPAEPVEVTGNEIRSGTHRWSAGASDDIVAVGDWDCDGTSTPAVLRPTTGRLHVFDTWATADAIVMASPGPSVPPGATALQARGCGLASVRTADGQTIDLPTAPAP